MTLAYKVSDKELLTVRNKIFTEIAIPVLKKKGFSKSPFISSWFGKNNLGDFSYQLCRLSTGSCLEMIVTHIATGDRSIQIYLNVFHLTPQLNDLKELEGCDGLNFLLPPNKLTQMQLREDDYSGVPLFNMLFMPSYKIETFYSEQGYKKKCIKLLDLIQKDMENIDWFVRRWHELHDTNETDWEGNKS